MQTHCRLQNKINKGKKEKVDAHTQQIRSFFFKFHFILIFFFSFSCIAWSPEKIRTFA